MNHKTLPLLSHSASGHHVLKRYGIVVYSILENYNARVDDHIVLSRESWWKDVLLTRQFGYNHN